MGFPTKTVAAVLSAMTLLAGASCAGELPEVAAEVPPFAKAILEGKKAPALPKPEGEIVKVKDTAGLEAAVRNLKSGQTILIAPGVYRPVKDMLVGPKDKNVEPLRNVAIRGETGRREDVVILGNGQENRAKDLRFGFKLYRVDGLLLADLSLGDYCSHLIMVHNDTCRARMYNLYLFDAGSQFVKGVPDGPGRTGAKDCIVEYCQIEYTKIGPVASDGYTQGIDIHRGDRWIIRDCLFRNQHVKPGLKHQWGPAILMWNDSRDTLVERCVFLDCDRGVALGLTDKSSKEGVSDHRGGMIRNNFFYTTKRITNADNPIQVFDSPGTKVLHNTVLTNGTYKNAIEYRFPATKDVIIANNVTDARIAVRQDAKAEIYGNFTKARPEMFVDAAGCDLHLKAAVPEIVGKAEKLRPPLAAADCADDFDGKPRRTDGPGDLGADQFGAKQGE